jgi:hypothetical protein
VCCVRTIRQSPFLTAEGCARKKSLVAVLVGRSAVTQVTPSALSLTGQLAEPTPSASASLATRVIGGQRLAQAATVVHARHARVADDQQASIGLAADQPPAPCFSDTAASAKK